MSSFLLVLLCSSNLHVFRFFVRQSKFFLNVNFAETNWNVFQASTIKSSNSRNSRMKSARLKSTRASRTSKKSGRRAQKARTDRTFHTRSRRWWTIPFSRDWTRLFSMVFKLEALVFKLVSRPSHRLECRPRILWWPIFIGWTASEWWATLACLRCP